MTTHASVSDSFYETEYFENGDYLTTTIFVDSFTQTRATSTKSASKTTTYCNSSGTVVWTFTVTGKFSYNGSTSSCTSASHSYDIKSSAWKVSSASSSKSGSTVSGTIVAKQYQLGVCLNTITRNQSLTCDKNGNLS